MPIYEYQGKSYDIASDDPAEAKKKILGYLSTGQGESTPVSAQPAPVEGSGGAAFGVYRPAGRRPENQNRNREENRDMAMQTVRGAASNVALPLGLPVDIGNVVYGQAIKPAVDFASSQAEQLRMPRYSDLPPLAQDIGNRIGSVYNQLQGNERQPLAEVPKMEKIPGIGDYGMGFYNQLVPGPEPVNAAQQLAFAGGQALGTPIATKALNTAVAAPRFIRDTGQQLGRGAMEGLNPAYRPGPNTAFAEMGNQYYPNKTVEPWMKLTPEQQVQGLAGLQASQQPSSNLFTGFLNRAAQRMAPEGPAGGTLVPLEGRGAQAFAEQTTRDFLNKPSLTNLSGATGNLGGAVIGGLTGGPIGAAAGFFAPQYIKALELLAQRRLQGTAALKPGFEQQLGQAQQTAGRLGLQGAQPQTPLLGYTPAGQTPMPMGTAPRAVNIEGQRAVLPYQIDTTNSQAARPIAAPITPTQTAQAAAASQVLAPTTPLQAAAQQTVAQKAQQVMGDKYRPPSGFEMDTKPTVDQILEQIKQKKAGVFETAGEAPAAPVDIASVRAKFADTLEQQRKNMMETRAQNKETYAGTETSLGKEKSQLGMGETPITTDAALKKMISQAEDIKPYKKNIIVNRAAYDDLALDAGVALDWSTAPDVSKMGIGDARKATNKWVYDSIKREAPELGLGVRGETQITQMNRANEQIPLLGADEMKAAMERSKRLRRPDTMEMAIDESKQPTATSKQVLKDKNLAIDEALANKLSKNTHDISYRMPGGLTVRDIKSKGRSEIVQSDKNGLEVSYITEGTGAAKQYIRRTVDRDGAVLKSETFTEKPTDWIRGLLEPLPEPTTTKADFLQDKMLADLSGEILPAKVYKDGDITVIAKPLQMFNKLEPAQKKQYLANGGLTHVSQRLDPTGKIDYKNMDKQLKQIQAAINKLD